MYENKDFSLLYRGLKSLIATAFPRQCPSCGRVYENPDDFICAAKHMEGQNSPGKSVQENGTAVLELYRYCVCGAALMSFFRERRDFTSRGLKRRYEFGKLLSMLEQQGLDRTAARRELVKIMHGRQSRLLFDLGISMRFAPRDGYS